MNLPFIDQEIHYSIAQQQDQGDAEKLVTKVFCEQEPLCLAMDIQYREFFPIARTFCETAIKQKMFVLARTQKEFYPIGFSIMEDYINPIKIEKFCDKFVPIFALFEKLDQHYQQQKIAIGEILHSLMIGVDNDRKKRLGLTTTKISSHLFTITVALAMTYGYRKINGHATSYFSQLMQKELGFLTVGKIFYKDFVFEGQHIFSNVRFHKGCALVEKTL